jgi:large subunit GTPase 1
LELWRQLWRVLERSDIVVQIVDSRNPLLFRSADLEKYASEFDPPKKCVLLVNKADLLSRQQIEIWRRYFDEHNIKAIFWSATDLPKLASVPEEDAGVSDQLQRTSLSESDEPYINDPIVNAFF